MGSMDEPIRQRLPDREFRDVGGEWFSSNAMNQEKVLYGVAIPRPFFNVLERASEKADVMLDEKLISWAMIGAESERKSRTNHVRVKK